MIKNIIYIFLIGIIISLGACVPPSEESIDDTLLATVYNKSLYLSELDGLIPRTSSPTDSSLIVNAYVERWVRENLMLYEAERNLPPDINIDKLVRDYRASLTTTNYEKKLVETQLDSIISDEEILEYYNKYKTNFQLETNILRCLYIKIKSDAPNLDKMENSWKKMDEGDNFKQLIKYCNNYALTYQLQDSIWTTMTHLETDFPKNALGNLKEGKEFTLEEEGFKYFMKIMEIKSKNSDPPLAYIRTHATKYILHNRKLKLIENKKEELYKKAQDKGHIKYFN